MFDNDKARDAFKKITRQITLFKIYNSSYYILLYVTITRFSISKNKISGKIYGKIIFNSHNTI